MIVSKPIIQSISAGNDAVREVGSGITMSLNNPAAIAKAALALKGFSSQEKQAMGKKSETFISVGRTYDDLAESFLQAVRSPECALLDGINE